MTTLFAQKETISNLSTGAQEPAGSPCAIIANASTARGSDLPIQKDL
jgi:hypothetical protein